MRRAAPRRATLHGRRHSVLCAHLRRERGGVARSERQRGHGDRRYAPYVERWLLYVKLRPDVRVDGGWPVGRRVQVDSLSSRPELNGLQGLCVEWVGAKRRFAVEVDGRGDRLALKAENLRSCDVEQNQTDEREVADGMVVQS